MRFPAWRSPRLSSRKTRWTLLFLAFLPFMVIGGEAVVRARLDPAQLGSGAVRVYARPVLFSQGQRPDRKRVRDQMERLGYRSARGETMGIGDFFLGSRGWIVGRRAFRGADGIQQAGFGVIRLDRTGKILRIEDEEGGRLREFSLEPELLGRISGASSEDRLPVSLDDVPEELIHALLTVEDQKFFEHRGLDYRRIGAAFAANIKAGTIVQGGSTLTQQLAKNLFLSPKRSLSRKVREAAISMVLESRYTKEEILQAYLNTIYLGQDGGTAIHGVGRAAQHFFGRDVSELGLSESALLIALIRAPSLYSPFRNPETAIERRDLVLRLMERAGRVAPEAVEAAMAEPLGLRKPSQPIRSARYFIDYLAESLELDGGDAETGFPHAVVSTLDADLQRAAEEAVENGLSRLERRFDWLAEGEDGAPLQASLVAMDPWTGEILAMVGGREYGQSQFNRATGARRQPGSAFKPIVAMAALSRGEDPSESPAFTLASVLDDGPYRVETSAGIWQPVNYDREFRGSVTLREALERSLNVPFARLGMAVGPERVVEVAHRMGIDSELPAYPSLSLGAAEVSPFELTRAFGVLAAEGFLASPKAVFSTPTRGERVFEPAETYLVTSALRGAVERGTGQGIRSGGYRGEVAAKSGTTNDYRDGWFVGYTPSLVVGVWVGFDQGKPLELPGAGVALPIFTEFLAAAVGEAGRDGPWGSQGFSRPSGLEIVDVESETGLRAGWGCRGEPEVFLEGTGPKDSCGEFRWDGENWRSLLRRGGNEVARLLRRLLSGDGEGRT